MASINFDNIGEPPQNNAIKLAQTLRSNTRNDPHVIRFQESRKGSRAGCRGGSPLVAIRNQELTGRTFQFGVENVRRKSLRLARISWSEASIFCAPSICS